MHCTFFFLGEVPDSEILFTYPDIYGKTSSNYLDSSFRPAFDVSDIFNEAEIKDNKAIFCTPNSLTDVQCNMVLFDFGITNNAEIANSTAQYFKGLNEDMKAAGEYTYFLMSYYFTCT